MKSLIPCRKILLRVRMLLKPWNGERGTGNRERGTGNGSLGTNVQRQPA